VSIKSTEVNGIMPSQCNSLILCLRCRLFLGCISEGSPPSLRATTSFLMKHVYAYDNILFHSIPCLFVHFGNYKFSLFTFNTPARPGLRHLVLLFVNSQFLIHHATFDRHVNMRHNDLFRTFVQFYQPHTGLHFRQSPP